MPRKSPRYSVGQLVEHPQRPQWGPGRVVAVGDERLHVFFRDDLGAQAKVILTGLVSLRVCQSQTDAILDELPAARYDGQYWVLPKPKRSPRPAGKARVTTRS